MTNAGQLARWLRATRAGASGAGVFFAGAATVTTPPPQCWTICVIFNEPDRRARLVRGAGGDPLTGGLPLGHRQWGGFEYNSRLSSIRDSKAGAQARRNEHRSEGRFVMPTTERSQRFLPAGRDVHGERHARDNVSGGSATG